MTTSTMQEVNNKPSLVGKIIHTSWGYDMTINEYAVIVEETDKTVKCKMLKMSVSDDNGKGNGRAMPILEEESEQPFRLHKRQWNGGEIYFKGSYPFCNGSKRSDCFSLWNGQANYHNTWD